MRTAGHLRAGNLDNTPTKCAETGLDIHLEWG
jgi:hypothetical protein